MKKEFKNLEVTSGYLVESSAGDINVTLGVFVTENSEYYTIISRHFRSSKALNKRSKCDHHTVAGTF